MSQYIFKPDAHPETNTVVGPTEYYYAGDKATFSEMRSGTLNALRAYSAADMLCGFMPLAAAAPNKWGFMFRSPVLFNTASLGGLVIASATLYVKGKTKYNENPANAIKLNVFTSNPASDTNLVGTDYNTFGDTPLSTPIAYAALIIEGWNSFALNAAGIAAINKTGITKLGLRESVYDAGGVDASWSGSPSQPVDCFTLYSLGDKGVYLEVIVTTLGSVRTDSATLVTKNSARLNGFLLDDGDESCIVGFQYGLTDAYGSDVGTQVIYENTAFYEPITGLLSATTYHFRAKALNTMGSFWGADRTFTTLGSVYPTVARSRVSGLVHRLSPGNYSLEVIIGGTSSVYVSPIMPGQPTPTIPTTPPPSILPPSTPPLPIPDTSLMAFIRWLGRRTYAQQEAYFGVGHIVTYNEWVAAVLSGRVPPI